MVKLLKNLNKYITSLCFYKVKKHKSIKFNMVYKLLFQSKQIIKNLRNQYNTIKIIKLFLNNYKSRNIKINIFEAKYKLINGN